MVDNYGYEEYGKKSKAVRVGVGIGMTLIVLLVVIFILVVACIITLKFFPDGIIAYYIVDFVEMMQEKLSGL